MNKVDRYSDTGRLRSYMGVYVYYNSDFGVYKATTRKHGDVIAETEKDIMTAIEEGEKQ